MNFEKEIINGFLNISLKEHVSISLINILKHGIKTRSAYEPIIFKMDSDSNLQTSLTGIEEIFRMSRMAYELLINNKISNLSKKDVDILIFVIREATSPRAFTCNGEWKVELLGALRYDRSNCHWSDDCEHYPILADQAGKSIINTVNS